MEDLDPTTLAQAQEFLKFRGRLEACWRAVVSKRMDVMVGECEPFNIYGPFIGKGKTIRFSFTSEDQDEYLGDLHWKWGSPEAVYHDLTEGREDLGIVPLFEHDSTPPALIHALALEDLHSRLDRLEELWRVHYAGWRDRGLGNRVWTDGLHMAIEGELSLTFYDDEGNALIEFLMAPGETQEARITRYAALDNLG